jgi:hypothetical protein
MCSCCFLIHYYQHYSNTKLIAFIIALDSAIHVLDYQKSRSNFNEGLMNLQKREEFCSTTIKELLELVESTACRYKLRDVSKAN